MIAVLVGADSRAVEVEQGELVGDRVELAADIEFVVAEVVDRCAEHGCQRDGTEGVVVVCHHVAVELAHAVVGLLILAELAGEDAGSSFRNKQLLTKP